MVCVGVAAFAFSVLAVLVLAPTPALPPAHPPTPAPTPLPAHALVCRRPLRPHVSEGAGAVFWLLSRERGVASSPLEPL